MSSRLFFSGKGNYVVWADDKKHFVLWLCIRIWRDDSIFVHLTRAVTRVLRYQSAEFQFLLYLLFFFINIMQRHTSCGDPGDSARICFQFIAVSCCSLLIGC